MATYKVPQDVEAEDKLIGFLSLKQFIFVLVMVASLWMCWLLLRVQLLLGLIPLPIAIVSGVLGLYQRNDQPVEIYLASWLRYHLKSRRRIWGQEGIEERVIITVPKVIEHNYTKGFTEEQVASRLNSLSSMLDSRGWASKKATLKGQPSQRLFNLEELAKFNSSSRPLDNAAENTPDQYDFTDKKNTVYQEVARDMTAVEKKQKQEAIGTVREALKQNPWPIPPQNYTATEQTHPITTTEIQLPPHGKKGVPHNETSFQHSNQKPKAKKQEETITHTQAGDTDEVVINLHRRK